MSDARIAFVVLGVAHALALGTRQVCAETTNASFVVLEWEGPSDCQSGALVQTEVSRLLSGAKAASEPLRVQGRVDRLAADRYRLVLETSDKTRRFRRELEARSCDELTKPAAIILALAVDPEATYQALATVAPRAEADSIPAPAQPEAKAPEQKPAEASGVPSPKSSKPPSLLAESAPNPALGPVPPDAGTKSAPSERRASGRLVPQAELHLVADFSTLPSASFGPGLTLALVRDFLRLETGGVYLVERRATAAGENTKGGDIDFFAANFGACLLPIQDFVELGTCLGVEAGRLHGQGFGVTDPGGADLFWLAGRTGAFLTYSVRRQLALQVRGDALARVGRSEFVISGIGPVHQPSSFGGRVQAGFAVTFP